MKSFVERIMLDTESPIALVDVTDRVRGICTKSGITNGLLTVTTLHTTTAVRINERCERLQEDMQAWLERLVPKAQYRHDAQTVDGRPNGRAHLMALLGNTSECIPIVEGELTLGGWQSLFFLELDGPRTSRTVVVQVLGE